MKLIVGKWGYLHKGERLDHTKSVVTHLEKKLRKKPHVLPKDRHGKGKKVAAAPAEEPGWFQKVKSKFRESFCLIDNRMYEAHVQDKKNCFRQKQIMRKMDIPVFDGSEENITPKEEWLAQGRVAWSDEEEEVEQEEEQEE